MGGVRQWKTSRRAMLILHVLDAPFIGVATFGIAGALGLEVGAVAGPWLLFSALRAIVVVLHLGARLAPVDRWEQARDDERRAALTPANAALASTPTQSALVYAFGWLGTITATAAWLWFAAPDRAPISLGEVISAEFVGVASLFGGMSFVIPILGLVLREQRAQASRELAAASLEPRVGRLSLGRQLALFLTCFVVAAAALIAAPSWSNHVAFERYQGVTELGLELDLDAARLAAGEPLERAQVVASETLAGSGAVESAAIELLPPLDAEVRVDRRAGRARLVRELEDGRALVVEGELGGVGDGYVVEFFIFITIMTLWAPLTIVLLIRSLVAPLRELDAYLSRLTQVGDLSALDHLPVIQYDEIGHLTRATNNVVVRLRALAEAALAVSKGELRVEIDASGELGAAFMAMVEQLDEIVTQIRATAVDVASVSTEIYAAAQRQEDAAGRSATTVTKVSGTVRSLADAAVRITASADEVLAAAERGSETADRMGERIDALTELAEGINDLVDQIREIADRSDLLALNGSLEATRAGEAGRGFALVAAEMRRLAERVTATVTDVRGRIAEIEASGGSARTASAATREISTQTASLAHDIAKLTRHQRDETEVASGAIELMAEFVTAASISTSQTREASGSLRGRVDELDRLVRQFETRRAGQAAESDPKPKPKP